MLTRTPLFILLLINIPFAWAADLQPPTRPADSWSIGAPIVTYWAGPGYEKRPMTDADARQMAEGGFNLVWSHGPQLDVVGRHKLRAILNDDLLRPETLNDPAGRQRLDALIARVKVHPALYAYHIVDEPSAGAFPALGKLVAYLRERDPAHLAYINLLPTYANNDQLGTRGDTTAAYQEHLRQFVSIVRPRLLSYDHYHFAADGDGDQYFLNLALMRRAALEAGLPFLNIVQACSWVPPMRAPTEHELRFLAYTTLAYGGQGISYFVYSYEPFYRPGAGQFTTPDGKPIETYHTAKPINREFVAVASELQQLRSLGAYHAGMLPAGAEPLPEDLPFRLDPPVARLEYKPPRPVEGVLIGVFGPRSKGRQAEPTHALIVNLDYRKAARFTLAAAKPLELFVPASRDWRAAAPQSELPLPPGGGILVRVK